MPIRSAIENLVNKLETINAKPIVIVIDNNLDDVNLAMPLKRRLERMSSVQTKICTYLDPLFDGEIEVYYRSQEAKWVPETLEGCHQRVRGVIDAALEFLENPLANRQLQKATITFKPFPASQEAVIDVNVEMRHPWGMGGISNDTDEYGRVQMTNNTPPIEIKNASVQFKLAVPKPQPETEQATGILAEALS